MNIRNQELERYEIKKPDYDLRERPDAAGKDGFHEPERFVQEGGIWKMKDPVKGFFKKKTAKLIFTGDITCFEKQFDEAKTESGYDFTYQFGQVAPVFAQADLVVGNLETMIFPEAPYRTEKYVAEQNFHCNAPIEFLDAVRKAGFDMVTNANNHDLDTGAIGIGETIDYVEQYGLIQTGTYKEEKKHYVLIDVNGIKIAITAFATEHNGKGCNLTKEGRKLLLSDYSPEAAEEILRQAKAEGAEAVICCMHWGRENKLKTNEGQRDKAKELAEMGYDCIIGSHPHVLQPFRRIKTERGLVPVFYSLGNFVSHNANNAKARSVLACLELSRKGGEVKIDCSYIPIYTSNNYGDRKYVILPIPENAKNPGNREKMEIIREVIGDKLEISRSYSVAESKENEEELPVREKAEKPDLEGVENFPVSFDDGRFIYSIFEDHVRIDAMSESAWTLSYSTPEKLLGLPVTDLAECVFENNLQMKKINLKKELPFVSRRACRGCTHLEGFQLGSSIHEIGEEAFSGCTSLCAAVMGKNVKKIGAGAFAGCTGLRSVKLSAGIEEIAEDAFAGSEQAVFYCEENTYADRFAREHGYEVINMELE